MFRNPRATAALQKTIAQHFVRTGALDTAHIFSEVNIFHRKLSIARVHIPQEANLEISQEDYTRFAELQTVVEALRRQDIMPALVYVFFA